MAKNRKPRGDYNGGPKKKMTHEERKAKYTQIARDRRDKKFKQERNRNITCFKCRKPGHTANDCTESTGKECCYKCGEMTHSLKECTKYNPKIPLHEQDLPYATCFICTKTGHLASQCTMNEKGIYVNGGCCHKCGSNLHRSTACPTVKEEKKRVEEVVEENYDDLLDLQEKADVMDKQELKNAVDQNDESTFTEKPKKKRRVVKF
jgi:zinc finger CCHC domain-containing protein 9